MNVITKADARKRGLMRYFTGVPCKYGHVDERFVRSGHCMECDRIRSKRRQSENPDLKKQRDREYRRNNKEKVRAIGAAWYVANRERVISKAIAHAKSDPEGAKLRRSAWKRRHPDKVSAHAALRRSRKANAVPAWFGELDDLVWREAATLVRLRDAATGFSWHADHMIPVAGKRATGLHVWNNCQVIPASMNYLKNNKHILTEPGEWISHLHQKI